MKISIFNSFIDFGFFFSFFLLKEKSSKEKNMGCENGRWKNSLDNNAQQFINALSFCLAKYKKKNWFQVHEGGWR